MIATTVDLPCIYNNSNAGLVASLIFVCSRLSSESSRQRGLEAICACAILFIQIGRAEKLMRAENGGGGGGGDEKQVIDFEWPYMYVSSVGMKSAESFSVNPIVIHKK